MIIHCPQCDYERLVDDDKLPASACMATCPKCTYRFNFRDCVSPECATEKHAPACTLSQEATAPHEATSPIEPSTLPRAEAESAPVTDRPEKSPLEKSSIEKSSIDAPKAVDAPSQDKDIPQEQEKKPSPKNMWDDLSSTINRWDSKQHTQDKKTSQDSTASQGATASQGYASDNIIPWENRETYTFFQGLIVTIKHAAMSPATFFGTMVGKAPLTRPLIFFVILGLFQAVMERLWYATLSNTLSTSIADPQLQNLLESISHDTNVFTTLLVTPFMLTIQVLILSGLYYLMFRFVRPDKADFKKLFRIMCYASAPTVICVIPIFGPIVASFFYLAWTVIGCKHGLDLPWSRIFMAVAPLYLLAIALILQVVHTLITSMMG